MSDTPDLTTFWDHLDELRMRLIRIVIVVVLMTIIAFLLKDTIFDVILAPTDCHFLPYVIFGIPEFSIQLINTGITEQFMVHMCASLYVGVLVASPYIIYETFRFVLPGLYVHERRYALLIVGVSYLMFVLGVLLDYFLFFPLALQFLGTYQVSEEITNMLTLQSYFDTLVDMSFMMGILFELPVLCWLLGRLGIINRAMMITYRRHAVVIILVIAAIVTPTTDFLTLFVVSLPIWMLYEGSIWLVK